MDKLKETATWVDEITLSKQRKNNNQSVVVLLTKDKRNRRL